MGKQPHGPYVRTIHRLLRTHSKHSPRAPSMLLTRKKEPRCNFHGLVYTIIHDESMILWLVMRVLRTLRCLELTRVGASSDSEDSCHVDIALLQASAAGAHSGFLVVSVDCLAASVSNDHRKIGLEVDASKQRTAIFICNRHWLNGARSESL